MRSELAGSGCTFKLHDIACETAVTGVRSA